MTRQLDENNEEALAEYFEQHAGEVDLWAKKPHQIRVRRGGPSHTFSVRFTAEELEELQDAADLNAVTVSELIRSAALKSACREPEGVDSAQLRKLLRETETKIQSLSDSLAETKRELEKVS
ncbi:MAG: hypothetical protein GEU75_10860 [Dehalococcoidia bacterium]|nr:hypothetical protein [Dehalococcoidia bacterium]